MATIQINVFKRPVLGTNRTQFKYYGQVKSKGTVSYDDLVSRIEAACTLTRADVTAVLGAIIQEVMDILKNGDGVSLGELGVVYTHVNSVMKINKDDLDVSRLKKVYPYVRVSKKLKQAVRRKAGRFNITRPVEQVTSPGV